MMKKLSKIALLAAASAFMLAVFPACGDDDEDNDPPKATLALVGDPVALKAGTPTPVEATVTVENDTFTTEAKAIPAGEEIPTTYFELKATDAKVTVSAAKVKTWDSDTKATITFTVTAAEGAAEGTISANIKKGTLTNTETITTTGNIVYTIKKADGGEEIDGDEGKGGVVWTWTVADYVKSTTTATAFGNETSCGNVTAGKNVKERKDGNINIGTIGDNFVGYFQLSNGADGSVWFTAPAGTKKIVVCAKLDATDKQIVLKTNAASTTKPQEELGKKTGEANANYKDHSFDVDITEDTIVYVGTFVASKTANLKAIQISK